MTHRLTRLQPSVRHASAEGASDLQPMILMKIYTNVDEQGDFPSNVLSAWTAASNVRNMTSVDSAKLKFRCTLAECM